jgi:hypothetical protein
MPPGYDWLNGAPAQYLQPGMVLNQFRWHHVTFGFRTTLLMEVFHSFVERGDEQITVSEFKEMLQEMGEYTETMDDNIRHMYWNFGALQSDRDMLEQDSAAVTLPSRSDQTAPPTVEPALVDAIVALQKKVQQLTSQFEQRE